MTEPSPAGEQPTPRPPLAVAGVQLVADADPATNLRRVETEVAGAAARGARLVVLPEATLAPFTVRVEEVAEPLDGPFAEGVRAAAERHGVTVVVGTFTPGAPDPTTGRPRVRNTLLVTGPGVFARYDKVHLFDAFGSRESATVEAGDGVVDVVVDGWRVGLATCFDIRFPEHFTDLRRRGCEVVVLPASWGGGPGKAEQWDLLTRARGHDAQAWVLAVGQAWTPRSHEGPYGIGRTCLTDPTGALRARLGAEEGVLHADLDAALVTQTRQRVPLG